VLHSFSDGPDGGGPTGSLILDAAGNLYGTTGSGGNFAGDCSDYGGCGNIFMRSAPGNGRVVYEFPGGADGASPRGVIRDPAGNLYGTTTYDGTYSEGTVFKVDPNGYETVLYSFTGHLDGGSPFAGLVGDSSGNLYGTTEGGGLVDCGGAGCGVVFKLDPTGQETVLHRFSGPDGALPESAGVVRDRGGDLYGVTYAGGSTGCGVVYKLETTAKETILHNFSWTDGCDPAASLLMGSGGIYGTALFGGASGLGDMFKITR
jgi:uncharacterized repeat protein (TIGR03803 family)